MTGARESISERSCVKQGSWMRKCQRGYPTEKNGSTRVLDECRQTGEVEGCNLHAKDQNYFAFFGATWHKGREQSDWCNRR